MKGFAAAVARLDAEVDTRLGDPLFYDRNGVTSTVTIPGFFTGSGDFGAVEMSDAPLDPNGARVRLQIARRYVETPSKSDRIRSDHPLCRGGKMKPAQWLPIKSGRYWLMDLERAS